MAAFHGKHLLLVQGSGERELSYASQNRDLVIGAFALHSPEASRQVIADQELSAEFLDSLVAGGVKKLVLIYSGNSINCQLSEFPFLPTHSGEQDSRLFFETNQRKFSTFVLIISCCNTVVPTGAELPQEEAVAGHYDFFAGNPSRLISSSSIGQSSWGNNLAGSLFLLYFFRVWPASQGNWTTALQRTTELLTNSPLTTPQTPNMIVSATPGPVRLGVPTPPPPDRRWTDVSPEIPDFESGRKDHWFSPVPIPHLENGGGKIAVFLGCDVLSAVLEVALFGGPTSQTLYQHNSLQFVHPTSGRELATITHSLAATTTAQSIPVGFRTSIEVPVYGGMIFANKIDTIQANSQAWIWVRALKF